MCGRYALNSPPDVIRSSFGYVEQPNFPPRYNIAPTQPIAIVCRDDLRTGDGGRQFRLVRWGYVPSFVKDWSHHPLIINARADGITEKRSFRAALMRRRCLVVADAYYEWRRTQPGVVGTPFLFRRPDGRPLAFAGLHERWFGADGSEMETACIVTTESNAAVIAVHPRMPVVLDDNQHEAWLDVEGVHAEAAAKLLVPANPDALDFFAVSPAVNKVGNDDPSIQRPALSPGSPVPARQGCLF